MFLYDYYYYYIIDYEDNYILLSSPSFLHLNVEELIPFDIPKVTMILVIYKQFVLSMPSILYGERLSYSSIRKRQSIDLGAIEDELFV